MVISIRKVNLMKLDQGEIDGINEVIEKSNAATVFHTLEWNRLLIEYFNLPYTALLAYNDQTIVGMHLLYPYKDCTYRSPVIDLQSVYGGPIAIGDESAIIHKLLEESERVCAFAYFQIWSSPRIIPKPFVRLGYQVEEMFTPIMKLDGSEEEQWRQLHKDKRYKIRRAKSMGLKVEEAGFEELGAYHEMVKETLSQANISPLPLGFLQKLMMELQSSGRARLFLVRHNHELASGTIILYHKDMAYGWDIGWRREFSNLSPNDLLTWEVAKKAHQDGLKYFDLLRIEPDRLPGIAKWKAAFGCEIVPCYFLRKATAAYRLFRPIRILFTQPGRVLRKLRMSIK